jgi:hypothetical protein
VRRRWGWKWGGRESPCRETERAERRMELCVM